MLDNHEKMSGKAPAQLDLTNVPFFRVMAQIRIPTLLAIVKDERKIAIYQEMIRSIFPYMDLERFNVAQQPQQVNQQGQQAPQQIQQVLIWRFVEDSRAARWRLSIGMDFIALETSSYTSKEDFVSKLKEVCAPFETTYQPGNADRVGVRFINFLMGDGIKKLPDLVQPGLLGVMGPKATPEFGKSVTSSFTRSTHETEEGVLNARWGLLPANSTHDQSLYGSVAETAWVLDIDASNEEPMRFVTDQVMDKTSTLIDRSHMFLHSAVTDKFFKFFNEQKKS